MAQLGTAMMEQKPHAKLKEGVWDILPGAGEQSRFEDYMGLVFIENQNKIYTPLLLTMRDPVGRGWPTLQEQGLQSRESH